VTRRRIWVISAAATTVIAGSLLYFIDPARAAFLPSCPLHRLSGLYCPGCGTTRALHALLHGNLEAALRLNPLTMLLLPVIVYLVVRRNQTAVRPVWIWSMLGLLIAFGVLRNLPVYPFSLLAP
jgi:hypothetical protein